MYVNNNPLCFVDPTGLNALSTAMKYISGKSIPILSQVILFYEVYVDFDKRKKNYDKVFENYLKSGGKLNDLQPTFIESLQGKVIDINQIKEKTEALLKDGEDNNSDKNESKSKSNPYRSEPNSESQVFDDNGNVKQTRKYAEDGYPLEDIDYDHDHDKVKPHKHEWTRPEDGSPPTHKNRQPGKPLNDTD